MNPYATPRSSIDPGPGGHRGVFRLGDLLYVAQGATFPPFCFVTGAPTEHRVAFKLSWNPRWIYLLLLLNILVLAVGVLLTRKRLRVSVPISPEGQVIRNRKSAKVLGVALGISVLLSGVAGWLTAYWETAALSFGLLAFLSVLLALALRPPLRPTGHDGPFMILAGAPQWVLDAAPEWEGHETVLTEDDGPLEISLD